MAASFFCSASRFSEFAALEKGRGIGVAYECAHILDERTCVNHGLRPVCDHLDISNEIHHPVVSCAEADQRTEVAVGTDAKCRWPKRVIHDLITEAIDRLMLRVEERTQCTSSNLE